MSDSYINSLIKLVSNYGYTAEYINQPISAKPITGCDLPTLTDLPAPLTLPTPPGTKPCVPVFTPFPIIPAPFTPPENCPNGLSISNSNVKIFAQIGDPVPAGTLAISASQNADFCSYSIDMPDIVIPCFPTGPQITGGATITVIDPNTNVVTSNVLNITKSSSVACNWNLDGNIDINLPVVPCQQGVRFSNDNLKINAKQGGIIVDRKLVSITKDSANACIYDLNMPTVTIPCYPNGPKLEGGVTLNINNTKGATGTTVVSTNVKSLAFSESNFTPCKFTLDGPEIDINIPCQVDGVTTTIAPWVIGDPYISGPTSTTLNATVTKSDFCNTNIALPPINIPCYPGGINFTSPIKFTAYKWEPTSSIGQIATGFTQIGYGAGFVVTGITNGVITAISCVSHGREYTTLPQVIAVEAAGGAGASFSVTNVTDDEGNPYGIDATIVSGGLGYVLGSTGIKVIPATIPTNPGKISSQVIDLTNNGAVRDATSPCTWNSDINIALPMPNCDGGFKTTANYSTDSGTSGNTGFDVIVGGNKLAKPADPTGYQNIGYNTVKLAQHSTQSDGKNTCYLSLEGAINLGISCPNGYSANPGKLQFVNPNKPVTDPGYVVGNVGVSTESCSISLTGSPVAINGLLPCDSPSAPSTSVTFGTGPTSASFLTFNGLKGDGSIDPAQPGSICNVSLAGVINIPNGGGGMSLAPWNPFSNPSSGQIAYAMLTEGGIGEFISLAGTTANDIPGASDKWELIGGGVEIPPFKVIKTDSPVPLTTANSVDANILSNGQQKEATVKVVPWSFLYSDEVNNTRIPIFGLDMPFLLKTGEKVYLEVVYLYTNTNGVGSPKPLYGAICKGTQYDFLINTNNPINADNNKPYKVLSKQNLTDAKITTATKLAQGDNNLITAYITSSLNNYVGLDSNTASDLFNIQALAIKQIASQTAGSSGLLWQFKSFQILAEAEQPVNGTIPPSSTANQYPIVPRKTGETPLIYVQGNGTSAVNNYYLLKQQVNKHQAIKLVNTGGSSNLPIGIVDDYNRGRVAPHMMVDSSNNPIQPNCDVTSPPTTGHITNITNVLSFDINNASNTPSSQLIAQLISNVSALTLNMTPALNIGTGPLDIKIYYCTDGHMPTVNTYASKSSSVRFDGQITLSNPVATPIKRISWIGVHPEFVIDNPGLTVANNTNVNQVTWS